MTRDQKGLPMTQSLEHLKELSEKATEGPWIVHPVMAWISPIADLDLPICQMRMATDGQACEPQAFADGSFIAASVNYVRSLLTSSSGIREQALEEAARLIERGDVLELARQHNVHTRNDGNDYYGAWAKRVYAAAIRSLCSKPLDPPHRQQGSRAGQITAADEEMFRSDDAAEELAHRQQASGEDAHSVGREALQRAHQAMACAIAFCGRGPGGANNADPAKWADMCSQIADELVGADQVVLAALASPQSSSVHPDVEGRARELLADELGTKLAAHVRRGGPCYIPSANALRALILKSRTKGPTHVD